MHFFSQESISVDKVLYLYKSDQHKNRTP